VPRFDLPPGLTPEEEHAIVAALEEYFGSSSVRPSPWALAGRAEGLGLGALQIRYQSRRPWGETRLNPYTRRGAAPRMGRGDSK
jgi:hypothetical protein